MEGKVTVIKEAKGYGVIEALDLKSYVYTLDPSTLFPIGTQVTFETAPTAGVVRAIKVQRKGV